MCTLGTPEKAPVYGKAHLGPDWDEICSWCMGGVADFICLFVYLRLRDLIFSGNLSSYIGI